MSIVLNSKTYNSVGFNANGQSVYKETSAGVPSGFSYLTNKVNTGTGKTDSTVKWNLSLPVIATADSACSCTGSLLRTDYIRVEATFGASSPLAERTDLLARLRALVLTPEFENSFLSLTQA